MQQGLGGYCGEEKIRNLQGRRTEWLKIKNRKYSQRKDGTSCSHGNPPTESDAGGSRPECQQMQSDDVIIWLIQTIWHVDSVRYASKKK